MKSFKQFLAEEAKKKLSKDPAFKILDLSTEFAEFPEGMSDDEMAERFWRTVEARKDTPEYEPYVRAKERHALHADLEKWDPELKAKIEKDYALDQIRKERNVLKNPLQAAENDRVIDFMKKRTEELFADPSAKRIPFMAGIPQEYIPTAKKYMKNLDILTSPGKYTKSQVLPDRKKATQMVSFGANKAVSGVGKAASALDPVSTAAESGISKVAGKVAGSVAGMWGLADTLFGQEAGRGSETPSGPAAQKQQTRDEILSAAMNPQDKPLPSSRFVPTELKREEFRRKYSR
jgi:hypothetical protein